MNVVHIIMHRIPSDNVEDEANLFASEFLCLKKKLLISFYVAFGNLANLKRYWKVSMQALLKRAHELNITHNQYHYAWKRCLRLAINYVNQ